MLAAIGSVETDHGRSTAPGVRSGVNSYGCCAGPMQFSVLGPASTWDTYGVDGDHDGRVSVYDPADAIPAAARYLRASGAPADYRAAIFAYNHADWYVAQVLAKADEYRAAAALPTSPGGDLGGAVQPPSVTVPAILRNPRITLTALQRSDVRSGVLDPRVLAVLSLIGEHHSVVVTAMKSDHSTYTVDGNVSNHSAGRAMDIGAVDGEICRGTRTGRCADLVRELAAMTGPLRSTELIYCWDPDGPARPARLRARRSLRPHARGMGRIVRHCGGRLQLRLSRSGAIAGTASAAGGGAERAAQLGEPSLGEAGDTGREQGLRDRGEVVEAERALLGHAVVLREEDFGRDAPDRPSCGCDQQRVEDRDGGLAGQHASGASAGVGVLDPPHLAAVHHGSAEIICLAACSDQTSSGG